MGGKGGRKITHLGKGGGVKSILAGNFQANRVTSLGVPGGLGTGLDLGADAMVVASGEEGEVVLGGDSCRVFGNAVSDCS